MAQTRLTEIKVGIFVLVCIGVMAGMIIWFGKYSKVLGESTYEIIVVFPNANGIVRDAQVLYAGIPVGKVRGVALDPGGALKVDLKLAIYTGYQKAIRKDAQFVINQSGLLGDRYVDVIPRSATAPPIQPGERVEGSVSVDLSEAIRSVVDVLKQAAGTIERVDKAIKRVDETVLSQESLEHIRQSMANVELVSSNTVELTLATRTVIEENRKKIGDAMTSFSEAAESLSSAAAGVEDVVDQNAPNINTVTKNLAESSQRLNDILARVEKGEGTAGKLLVDASLYNELLTVTKQIRDYGVFYNTWFGRKLPKTKPGPAKQDAGTAAGSSKKGQ